MDGSIRIRAGSIGDAEALAELAAVTFRETFEDANTPADLEAYLASAFSEAKLRAELEDSETTFLLALPEAGRSPIGYAKLRANTRHRAVAGASPIELERLYVRRDVLGLGVGAALLSACFEEALRVGHDTVWLGVWEHNPRAIEFYRRWGFREVGSHTFLLGSDEQNDLIMARAVEEP